MRPVLFLTLLLSSACAAGGALAQQGSNWIDPPAKSGAAPAGGERAKPVAKAAPRFEVEPEARTRSRRAAAPSPAPARRDMHRQDRTRAAEMRRARRAAIHERAREERYGHTARIHRPTQPPAPPPAANLGRAEPDPRFSDWAVAAGRLSLGYLDSVSAPNGVMLSAAPRFYGSTVRFHGRVMTTNALLAEKQRFAQRWPERRYEPHGEPRIACDGASATCLVRIVHDFTAASPARGARSQGVAELTLTVSFAGGAPVIVSEASRVLSRAGA
ncbi:hypothetical protein [Methylorubrum sp. SL192]|uniref:hypothetical protein n=1 Tax=Methylorubrum sp. SL192 TaxID=2995167 RepID=UPI002273B182|nr:hypothetical protein [Methylorubrum sp. SL192]MCY1641309.1 hypothetical protein [Methylorubrum sp. SL192]